MLVVVGEIFSSCEFERPIRTSVCTPSIYMQPHLPYNGGFQFAGVNLQNIFQFDTKNQKKYTQNELFGHTEE